MKSVFFVYFIISLLLLFTVENFPQSAVVACLLHTTLGIYLYLVHGRNKATILGVYALISVLLLALPYLYTIIGKIRLDEFIRKAVVYSSYVFSATTCAYFYFSSRNKELTRFEERQFQQDSLLINKQTILIIISGYLVFGLLASNSSTLIGRFAEAALFNSVVLSFYLVVSSYNNRSIINTVIVGLVFTLTILIYLDTVFNGFGRIRLVSMGMACMILASFYVQSLIVKVSPLVFFPFFLVWSGSMRSGLDSNFSILTSGQGLGSFMAPLITLGRLLREYSFQRLDYLFGESYLYVIYYWIPRSVWPDKPDGLGRIYVEWLEKSLLVKGHSISGSYVGEMFVNFGILGVIFVPLVLGYIFVRFSWLIAAALTFKGNAYKSLMLMLMAVIFIATVPDFVWADSNTLVQRAGTRLVLIYATFYLLVKKNRLPGEKRWGI